jgi:hypothetical protein
VKTRIAQALGKRRKILYAKFDFRLHRYHNLRVYGTAGGSPRGLH